MIWAKKYNGACEICGQPVTGQRRKYCSQGCGRIAYNRRVQKAHEMDRCPIPVGSREQRKIRTCLRCPAEFASSGPGNRICPRCTKNENQNPHGAIRRGRLPGLDGHDGYR